MKLPNTFESSTTQNHLERLEKLTPTSTPNWGKMNASQLLAHLNVTYDMTYNQQNYKMNWVMRTMLKMFVKSTVVSDSPYEKNGRTAPQFVIVGERDFEKEKTLLISNIKKTQELGAAHFEGKENVSFGKLNSTEWSNLFSKHLEHHFAQFGV